MAAVRALAISLPSLMAGCSTLAPKVDGPEVMGFAQELRTELAQSRVPVSGTLDVDQAVARAVSFNNSIRLAQREAAVSDAKLRFEAGALLPDIIAESQYFRRSKPSYSRSRDSDKFSTSSDIDTITKSAELSFNILDFGLTLVRLRQAGDQSNQKYEEIRKTALRIAEETRATYWKAVALHALKPALQQLDPKLSAALNRARRAAGDTSLDPSDFITFQRDLLNTRREVNDLLSQIAGADQQLKSLISAPDERLALDRDQNISRLKLPATTPEEDIARALTQRPEIRQVIYDMRITENEVHASLLKLLPGATLSQKYNADSTPYLLYGDWVSWTARAVVNLIELVRLPGKLEQLESEQDFNREKALAMASAIALQVHVARHRLAIQMQVYRDAEEFANSQADLLKQVRNAVAAGALPQQMIAREELSTLLARTRATLAFGELHAAQAAFESATSDSILPMIAFVYEE